LRGQGAPASGWGRLGVLASHETVVNLIADRAEASGGYTHRARPRLWPSRRGAMPQSPSRPLQTCDAITFAAIGANLVLRRQHGIAVSCQCAQRT